MLRYLACAVALGLGPATSLLAQAPVIPAPRGWLNDFANVVPPAQAARIVALAQRVREASQGEIAVVTLPDLAGRDVGDVALRIGREWGVGAKGEAGDPAKNAGVVVLLVPKETSQDGRGHISITIGRGVEGFIPDAVAGDIRREATPFFRQRDYGAGLELITARLAERYAAQYGFALDGAAPAPPTAARRKNSGIPFPVLVVIGLVLLAVFSGRGRRGRRGGGGEEMLKWMVINSLLNSGRRSGGGWSSGGLGGGGGGFGGGFGGFGGGGGFSGGGSSGDW
ncbi:MAG: TPM domain-containing protein [Gemmatimonadota bacterium]|jgi:uncharacterized protein|nr:TPM domain-containing protein [Gemmatimonadota bacterium]